MTSLPTPAEWLAQFQRPTPCDSATIATIEPPGTVATVAVSQAPDPEIRSAAGPGEPLVLRDGRRLWRVLAGRGGRVTDDAAALVAAAKSVHVVTVADGAVLSVCIPRSYRGDMAARLAARAADVLAVLHRQSDERMQVAGLEASTR